MTKFVFDNGKNLFESYDKTETDALLALKANAADVYDKTAIDNALELKANAADVYSKTDADALLALKADADDVYTKTAADALLAEKANAADVYNKTETDALLENKADIDGEYDYLTAGLAKQLKSNVGEIDKEPYNFRTAGGSIDIGDRETDKIIGGTVAFNQLVDNNNLSANKSSISYVSGKAIITATGGDGYFGVGLTRSQTGHKYLAWYELSDINGENITGIGGSYGHAPQSLSDGLKNSLTEGFKAGVFAGYENRQFYVNATLAQGTLTTSTDTFSLKNIAIFDLTAMLGSTIADYIYNLEFSTTGAGVAWFKKLFPKPYYAYNAGELMSVKTSAHVTTGFNQWDEEWESGTVNYNTGLNENDPARIRSKNYIPIIPNTRYYFKSPSSLGLRFYDANKNFLGSTYNSTRQNNSYTTPENAYFMRFSVTDTTTYNHDICINLSWDGERDGEYEPYVKNTYPLDADLELRGIPKLDADNKLFYDGDEYSSDGNVLRRFEVIDLGSLTYNRSTSYTNPFFYATLEGNKHNGESLISKDYTKTTGNASTFGNNAPNKSYAIGQSSYQIFVRDDACTDAATFKTAMSGVYLVYEKETPTEETADEYQNPQIVDNFGTEAYIDGRAVEIPVGHDTVYQANLRAKIETAPDVPNADGDYILRQTSGANAYVLKTNELPAKPTTDGTYVLKCVVSSGTPTLVWVEET